MGSSKSDRFRWLSPIICPKTLSPLAKALSLVHVTSSQEKQGARRTKLGKNESIFITPSPR